MHVRRFTVTLALVVALAAGSAEAAPLDRVVARGLAGRASGAYVLDTTTGRTLAAVRADVPRIPASVAKLYTGAAALLRFGVSGTLDTTVLGVGELTADGVWRGDLYLRGGGDPTFGSASFTRRAYGFGTTVTALAERVAATGILRVTGRVYGDESWFDSRRGGPSTRYALDRWIGGPLSALLYNRGLAREDGRALQARPAKFAAKQLVAELRHLGVRVPRGAGERPAPAEARELARVSSPTMPALVRLTLVPSDNLMAEMLLKALGARFGGAGSTSAGAAVVRQTVRRWGIAPRIVDGSGLSRANATTPRQVVRLLDGLRGSATFQATLPVAGRSGTLATRMRRTAAQDRCRAKTGTLSNVSALAGYCATPNGHLIAFAFISNGVATWTAKAAEDRLLVRLARYRPAGGKTRPAPAPLPAPSPAPAPAPSSPAPAPSGGAAPAP